jgi:hypothetical protein
VAGFTIKHGNYTTYESCAMAKPTEKNVPKKTLIIPKKGRIMEEVNLIVKYKVVPTKIGLVKPSGKSKGCQLRF